MTTPLPSEMPDNKTLATIKDALKVAGIENPKAVAQAVKDYGTRYVADNIDAYLVLLQDEHPDLCGGPTTGDPFGEHAELIERAFNGKGNADARQTLLKTIGQEAARRRCLCH